MENAKTLIMKGVERWNAHDREGFLALYDEAISFVDMPTGHELHGREEFGKGFYDVWAEAYPDNLIKEPVVFAEGDLVCLEARFVGTHTGIYHGPGVEMPATGKRIDGPYVFIAEVRDGKVTRARIFYDRLSTLEQEGIVTPEVLAQLPVS